jgi:hypothetical protein
MSTFGKGYTLKSFGAPQPIDITNKISKNKLRKEQKQSKKQENNDLGITDAEFESMMSENENENQNENQNEIKYSLNNKAKIKITYKIPEPDDVSSFVKELLQKNKLGQELVDYIELNYNCLNGIELLNGLLKSQSEISDKSDMSWFGDEKYGLGLKKLFESNIHDQIIGLLMLQNYCLILNLPKIQYKNNSIYFIKGLFQLFFTRDIFDEEAYWKWQEYIDDNSELDDELKKKLSIQTAEFFIILKTVFIDEDYENENEEDEQNQNNNSKQTDKNLKQELNKQSLSNEESDEESDNSNNSQGVPEEQDFNLDDI